MAGARHACTGMNDRHLAFSLSARTGNWGASSGALSDGGGAFPINPVRRAKCRSIATMRFLSLLF